MVEVEVVEGSYDEGRNICVILYVNLTYTDGHIKRHILLLAEMVS